MCCSQWGFCGNTLDHCLPNCNRAFGHCLLEDGGNNSTDVSGTSPAATTTATATDTATVTKSVTRTHTSTKAQPGALETVTMWLGHTVHGSCSPAPRPFSTVISPAAPNATATVTKGVILTHTSIERHLYTTASLTRTIERTVYPAWCPAVALEGTLPTVTVSLNHTVYESCRPSATGVQDIRPAVTPTPIVTETRVLTKTHLSTAAVLTKTLQRTIYQSCRPKAFEA